MDDGRSENKLHLFLSICQELGVPMVQAKTESGVCLIFLGIELDSVAIQVRLPQNKLDKAFSLVRKCQNYKKITVKQLESLIVILSFAC